MSDFGTQGRWGTASDHSELELASSVGSVPLILVRSMAKTCSAGDVMFGMVPLRLLTAIESSVRVPSVHSSGGSVPLRREVPPRSMYCSCVRSPHSVGSVPESEVYYSCKWFSAVSCDSCVGKLPTASMQERLSKMMSPVAEHSTPRQGFSWSHGSDVASQLRLALVVLETGAQAYFPLVLPSWPTITACQSAPPVAS